MGTRDDNRVRQNLHGHVQQLVQIHPTEGEFTESTFLLGIIVLFGKIKSKSYKLKSLFDEDATQIQGCKQTLILINH